MYSGNAETCSWAARLLSKLAYELEARGLSGPAYEWFIEREEGGLEACIYAKRKQGDIAEILVPVITQFGKHNLMELFTMHMRNFLADKAFYFDFVQDMFYSIVDTSISRESFVNSGLLDYWIELALRQADFDGRNSTAERVSAISFLVDVWAHYSGKIEEREEIANAVLKVLKKGCRDRVKNIRMVSIASLYKLLDVFTNERNKYAPILYKTLTFLTVENHNDSETREFMLRNFISLFNGSQSIPVAILLEHLLKQLKLSAGITYIYNTFDFELFLVVTRHPRMNPKLCVMLLDVLAKIVLQDVTFSTVGANVFILALQRFSREPSVQEYLTSFFKLTMNVLLDYDRQSRDLERTQKNLNDSISKMQKGKTAKKGRDNMFV